MWSDGALAPLNSVIFPAEKVGQIALSFLDWIRNECVVRNIKRLYFLARDGYVFIPIMQSLCKKYNTDIECRYLYCSRYSLRLPSYYVSSEEIDKHLFSHNCKTTAETVLSRLPLTQQEKDALYKELGIDFPDKMINPNELKSFTYNLKHSDTFTGLTRKKSAEAYNKIIEYFRQEELLDTEHIAIVDSGWNGTLQYSLSLLLKNEGFNGKITGFYFGLYSHPDKKIAGEYLSYYFRPGKKDLCKKALFNCYVFENIFTADHGMTLGYCNDAHGIYPVLAPYEPPDKMREQISAQLNAITTCANVYIEYDHFAKFSTKKKRKQTFKFLKEILFTPTEKLADYFSIFRFCDDVTEAYSMQLCDREQVTLLKKYMFIYRLHNKLTGKPLPEPDECLWPYGTASFCGRFQSAWVRANIFVMEFLRLLKN